MTCEAHFYKHTKNGKLYRCKLCRRQFIYDSKRFKTLDHRCVQLQKQDNLLRSSAGKYKLIPQKPKWYHVGTHLERTLKKVGLKSCGGCKRRRNKLDALGEKLFG